MNDNIDPQRLAADPGLSAFVSANAGSGKTKTLIDRVARLLLAGAEPETILCVTYTKAAAAEMQRRLFALLGEWSVWSDDRLRDTLAALQGDDPAAYDERRLSKARGLFARALETPGGLKIQTIHAFCTSLLHQFPFEADAGAGFEVLDDAKIAAALPKMELAPVSWPAAAAAPSTPSSAATRPSAALPAASVPTATSTAPATSSCVG